MLGNREEYKAAVSQQQCHGWLSFYIFLRQSLFQTQPPTKDAWMQMNEEYLDAHVLHFNARESVVPEKNGEKVT